MRNLSGKMAWLAVIIIVGGLGLLSSGAAADTFVSYNGKFHFSYPEAWVQVDYTTAEYYLTHGNPENQVDFEAVFSEKQSFVIFQGQYMILTVDTLGPMSAEAVDSVVTDISSEFNRPVKELSPEEFLSGSLVDTIAFDRANNLIGIESEVAGGDAGPRVNLLVMKLYEHGIANYYFYTPKVEFMASLSTYRDMVTSFSTEALESSNEEVRIADLDDDNDSGMPVAIYGGLVAVLIAVIASRKRRAKKQ